MRLLLLAPIVYVEAILTNLATLYCNSLLETILVCIGLIGMYSAVGFFLWHMWRGTEDDGTIF